MPLIEIAEQGPANIFCHRPDFYPAVFVVDAGRKFGTALQRIDLFRRQLERSRVFRPMFWTRK